MVRYSYWRRQMKPFAELPLDEAFLFDADRLFKTAAPFALTFDDVSLATRHSDVLPRETKVATELAPGLFLKIPIISSDMDTVTGSEMAIAMSLCGGLGLIHYNFSDERQLDEVLRVKTFSLEGRDTSGSSLDPQGRLLCGVAISAKRRGDGQLDRDAICAHTRKLIKAGVNALAVSTAHGYTEGVGETVRLLREAFPTTPIIAGNVTSASGVAFLAEAGANIIKVGQGPGSICTTRQVAGVGIPQLTALYLASRAARECGVTLIADGGITKSGDIVKALTLADAVILGGLLASAQEAPGKTVEYNGKLYKEYRGMGSLGAMNDGSAARYGHQQSDVGKKVTPEGIEAMKPLAGKVADILKDLIGGLQSGMGYVGAGTLADLKERARYIRVTNSGQREAAPHDVVILGQ